MKRQLLLSFLFLIGFCTVADAQNDTNSVKQIIRNTGISGNWFLAYTHQDYSEMSKFQLKRGYINIKKTINDRFLVRYTQDITIDKEGGDAGNVETRMKYLFIKMKVPKIKFITQSYFEVGLVHRPWLDYEQKINEFRVQGKMFIERHKIINSADFGISYIGLLGGEIDKDYQKKVSKAYPGKYGSFSFGVYNGGGYSAPENNQNKTLEGRLSLRPLPELLPGVQLSYAYAYGKANTVEDNADFKMNIVALSTESQYHTFYAQYYFGEGGYKNNFVTEDGISYQNNAYSVFGEFKIPKTSFSVFSRYDYFESDRPDFNFNTILGGGLAYRFLRNKVVLHYEAADYHTHQTKTFELALEISFK